jgi:hypothetical protein
MALATPSLAINVPEAIYLNLSSSRVLGAEINFYKTNKAENEMIISVLENESAQYLHLSNEYEQKIILLDQDKTILRTRGDKFEGAFMDTSKSLVQCKDDTPSRFVWFSVGAITSVVLGLTGIFLIKK